MAENPKKQSLAKKAELLKKKIREEKLRGKEPSKPPVGRPYQTLMGKLNTVDGSSPAKKIPSPQETLAKLKSVTKQKDVNKKDVASKKNILSLTIRDKGTLYSHYMPFIENGGLFIPTDRKYALGDEVLVILVLSGSILPPGATSSGSSDKLPIAGKVIWISPKQTHKTVGIGIQFNQIDRGATKSKIERQLAGSLKFDRATHTM